MAVRVIDSDTIDAWVEVSFGVALRHRIRLIGVEGGELETPEGEQNKAMLAFIFEHEGKKQTYLVGCLRNRDNHGRLVGDIRLADNQLLCNRLLQTGRWRKRTAYKPGSNQ